MVVFHPRETSTPAKVKKAIGKGKEKPPVSVYGWKDGWKDGWVDGMVYEWCV
jgi:hypothetical protein